MAVLDGCQNQNRTPQLVEIKCPECGEELEVFATMFGMSGASGRTAQDETCPKCGHVIAEGTPVNSLK